MQLRARTARQLLQLGLLVSVCGCAREAPGPRECHEFSLRSAGVSSSEQQRLDPRVGAVVHDLTVRCLTTPFDRKLLACVDRGGELRACFLEFQARHPERAARAIARQP
jgi:hypothetical protein